MKLTKVWVQYAKVMTPSNSQLEIVARIGDPEAREKLKVLDIASSHGMFGLMFLSRNPNAICHAIDFKEVLEIGVENAKKFGVSDRYFTIPGSVIEVEIEDEFDIILIPNLMHYLSKEECEILMKKAYKSLKENGKIIVLEILNRESTISWVPTVMNLVLLATSKNGEIHNHEFLKSLFEKCNLKITQEINGDPLILYELKK